MTPDQARARSVITASSLAYYAALEASCANMPKRDNEGELIIITSRGTAEGTQAGVRL